MKHSIEDKTLALAGVYQAVRLVQQVARHGSVPDVQLSALLETLFRFDAAQVMDVYGDASTIKKGLDTLIEQLSGQSSAEDMELTRYVISLLHLEKALRKAHGQMDKLADALQQAQHKIDYFSVSHENMLASLADIYQKHISPLGPKIMVQGEASYLSQSANANKVRALLLAGIRSAVLWNQCGGTRWQLLLSRKKYIKAARQLLNTI